MGTKTAGQTLTATLRTMHRIGPRTRAYRDSRYTHMREEIMQSILDTARYPGCRSAEKEEILRTAFTAVLGWYKHIDSGRFDPVVTWKLKELSPYQFCAFLGKLVDAGISNTGEMENWLRTNRHEFVEPQRAAA